MTAARSSNGTLAQDLRRRVCPVPLSADRDDSALFFQQLDPGGFSAERASRSNGTEASSTMRICTALLKRAWSSDWRRRSWRHRDRRHRSVTWRWLRAIAFRRAISALARLPILIPGVIVGIALLILVNLAGLGPSRIAIVLGHTLVALPTTVVIMRGEVHGAPEKLHRGGDGSRRARMDDVPPCRCCRSRLPAIASSFMLSFLTSFDEFIVAFFLSGTEPTLPLFIWSQLRFPKALPSVMALGTVILAVSIVIATAAEIIRRRGAAVDDLAGNRTRQLTHS